jgi:hypothetical protein
MLAMSISEYRVINEFYSRKTPLKYFPQFGKKDIPLE